MEGTSIIFAYDQTPNLLCVFKGFGVHLASLLPSKSIFTSAPHKQDAKSPSHKNTPHKSPRSDKYSKEDSKMESSYGNAIQRGGGPPAPCYNCGGNHGNNRCPLKKKEESEPPVVLVVREMMGYMLFCRAVRRTTFASGSLKGV